MSLQSTNNSFNLFVRIVVFFGVAVYMAFGLHSDANSHVQLLLLRNHIHTEKAPDGV